MKQMALKKQRERDAHEKKCARESERRKSKKTGSVYRIVKNSTIYTASFKTQMSSTI